MKLTAHINPHQDGGPTVEQRLEKLGCVVVMPTYNNAATVGYVLDRILRQAGQVIVVNDGSTDDTARILSGYTSESGVEVIAFPSNRGKGPALKAGLRRAYERDFAYALTIDSDGQHLPEDIPLFAEAMEQNPGALIVGARNLRQDNMPSKNTFANRFSNFWVLLETGVKMQDTQSGFRAYPLGKTGRMKFLTGRYEFELEILVRTAWKGVRIMNIPVRVYYPPGDERVSHFRPARDFARISLLNSLLILGALLFYYPWKFIRWCSWGNLRGFFRKHLTQTGESNFRISLAVANGVFWGIAPVWGYQMILAGVTSHFMKLNKMVAVLASNISIPIMIPFIIYGSLAAGAIVLGMPLPSFAELRDVTWQTIGTGLLQYVLGSVVFGVAAGIVLGALSYVVLSLTRRKKPANG